MRALSILLILSGLAVGAATAYIVADRAPENPTPAKPSGEFRSGPQVGAKLPGTFEPLNLNGPDAGQESCILCRYGSGPGVLVFARRPSDALADLVRRLESASSGAKGEAGACVVVTDTSDGAEQQLKSLAQREKLQHVILGVINAGHLKRYELHPESEVTVIGFTKQIVRLNRAFRAGELTAASATEVAGEVTKLLASN